MPDHPFTHAYIGLGLLDESSILRDGDAWGAEYKDAEGRPYLAVFIGPNLAKILEFDGDERVAVTVAPTLARAIQQHGTTALGGEFSRFWARVARAANMVWLQLSPPEAVTTFVPAIGLGHLVMPTPWNSRWRRPEPGPIARRLGCDLFREPYFEPGTLLRYIAGEPRAPKQRVRIYRGLVPGILVAEVAAAYYAANGPLRSIEWRPFVLPSSVLHVGQAWPSIRPVTLPDGTTMTGFAIVADQV